MQFTNADVEAEVQRRFPDFASFSPDLRCGLADDVKKEWSTELPCGHTVYDHVKEFGPQMTDLMMTVPLTLIALVMGELDGLDETEPVPAYTQGQRVVYTADGPDRFARIETVVNGERFVIRYRKGPDDYVTREVHAQTLRPAPLSDEEKYGR